MAAWREAQDQDLPFNHCIFSVLQYSYKWHTLYKIALPVHLRDYLAKGDLH